MAETAIIRSIGGLMAEVVVKEQHRDDLTVTRHPVERGAAISDHAYKEPAQLTLQAGWSAAYLASNGAGQDKDAGILGDIGSAVDQFSTALAPLLGTAATKTLSEAVDTASALRSGSSANAVGTLFSQATSIATTYGNQTIVDALGEAYQLLKQQSGSNQSGGGGSQSALNDLYQQLLDLQESAQLIEVQTGRRLYESMLIKSLAAETDEGTANVLFVTMQLQEVILVDTAATTMPDMSSRATPQSTSGVQNTGTKSLVPLSGPVF